MGARGESPKVSPRDSPACQRFVAKISQRKSGRTGLVETAGMRRVSGALVRASEPVKRVLYVARCWESAHIRLQHVRRFRLSLQIGGPGHTPRGCLGILAVRK